MQHFTQNKSLKSNLIDSFLWPCCLYLSIWLTLQQQHRICKFLLEWMLEECFHHALLPLSGTLISQIPSRLFPPSCHLSSLSSFPWSLAWPPNIILHSLAIPILGTPFSSLSFFFFFFFNFYLNNFQQGTHFTYFWYLFSAYPASIYMLLESNMFVFISE